VNGRYHFKVQTFGRNVARSEFLTVMLVKIPFFFDTVSGRLAHRYQYFRRSILL